MDRDTFTETIRKFKNRKPFKPFIVVTMNGNRYEVDLPEAIVVREGLAVFIGPGRVPGFFDNEGVKEIVGDLGGGDHEPMFYEVDLTAQASRYFSKEVRYSQIDWANFDQIVDAFSQRILDWYVEPATELAKNGHFAFSVMALNCLLIDTLSQFVSGKEASSASEFKKFIRERLPSVYSCQLRTPIQHDDGKRTAAALTDIADVLYRGYRCGILHQAHIPPYGGVDPGQPHAAQVINPGLVKYKATSSDCPTVLLNPLILFRDVRAAYDLYLIELKNRDAKFDQSRANFKSKFSRSFGVDVTGAK